MFQPVICCVSHIHDTTAETSAVSTVAINDNYQAEKPNIINLQCIPNDVKCYHVTT